jgi:hypothetical protein
MIDERPMSVPSSLRWIQSAILSREWNPGRDLWEPAMNLAQRSKCENLPDKVYGIQSLLLAPVRIPVDYNSSTRDVFLDAAIAYER